MKVTNTKDLSLWFGTSQVCAFSATPDTWNHIAISRSGTTLKVFVNGKVTNTVTNSQDATQNGPLFIGTFHDQAASSSDWGFSGKVSNFRIVKGTAVYTTSFRPPTEPLTNITNTKLLFANNSSVTGYTVANADINSSNATANTDSPFDDPASFNFGDNGEGLIKCGSYYGNGSADGPEIELGWEPQYVLIKRVANAENWLMIDSMRGWSQNGTEYGNKFFNLNVGSSESHWQFTKILPTGFKCTANEAQANSSGSQYIYFAIRRADGYVGKPVEDATKVFAMNVPSGSSTTPEFISNFPVDFGVYRKPAATESWYNALRLAWPQEQKLNDDTAAANWAAGISFDYSNGWATSGQYNPVGDWQSWMWKRHAGFDTQLYVGNDGLNPIKHGLGKTPEMIWVKRRDPGTAQWTVYHKGLNGGTNPHHYYLVLNTNAAEVSQSNAPYIRDIDSVSFTVCCNQANSGDDTFLALSFASIPGVSKLGYYTGNGNAVGSSPLEITVGFQPRFVIIKRRDGANAWTVLDTTRGWGSGNDQYITLNDTTAQSAHDLGAPTSTGFTVDNDYAVGGNGANYIYYAHA